MDDEGVNLMRAWLLSENKFKLGIFLFSFVPHSKTGDEKISHFLIKGEEYALWSV